MTAIGIDAGTAEFFQISSSTSGGIARLLQTSMVDLGARQPTRDQTLSKATFQKRSGRKAATIRTLITRTISSGMIYTMPRKSMIWGTSRYHCYP